MQKKNWVQSRRQEVKRRKKGVEGAGGEVMIDGMHSHLNAKAEGNYFVSE